MLGLIFMLGIGVVFGLVGLYSAGLGVRGIVTKHLEVTDESGTTTTFTGRSAVLYGSLQAVFGGSFMLGGLFSIVAAVANM